MPQPDMPRPDMPRPDMTDVLVRVRTANNALASAVLTAERANLPETAGILRELHRVLDRLQLQWSDDANAHGCCRDMTRSPK